MQTCVILHRELPNPEVYHTFSETRNNGLSKKYNENLPHDGYLLAKFWLLADTLYVLVVCFRSGCCPKPHAKVYGPLHVRKQVQCVVRLTESRLVRINLIDLQVCTKVSPIKVRLDHV